MAVVKGSVIGFLSGKLGHLAARTIKGRTILSARPVNFNVSYVPALVEIRKKFANTSAFVKNMFDLSTLIEVWKLQDLGKLSLSNFAFQKNFGYSSADKPTVNNIITPDGFPNPVDTVTIAADKITVNLKVMSTLWTFDQATEKNLSAAGLVVYYNPIVPDDKPFEIISFKGEISAVDFELPNTIEHTLDVKQQAIAARYQKKILYFMVATKNWENDKVVQYSDTYTKDV